MDTINLDEFVVPIAQQLHDAEDARRARQSLYRIYCTSEESIRLTADLVLGARKPPAVFRA